MRAQSPVAAAVQVHLQHTTPPKPTGSQAKKKLFQVDDGGGKDSIEAQIQHGGQLTEDEIQAERVKTVKKRNRKEKHQKKQIEREWNFSPKN